MKKLCWPFEDMIDECYFKHTDFEFCPQHFACKKQLIIETKLLILDFEIWYCFPEITHD